MSGQKEDMLFDFMRDVSPFLHLPTIVVTVTGGGRPLLYLKLHVNNHSSHITRCAVPIVNNRTYVVTCYCVVLIDVVTSTSTKPTPESESCVSKVSWWNGTLAGLQIIWSSRTYTSNLKKRIKIEKYINKYLTKWLSFIHSISIIHFHPATGKKILRLLPPTTQHDMQSGPSPSPAQHIKPNKVTTHNY